MTDPCPGGWYLKIHRDLKLVATLTGLGDMVDVVDVAVVLAEAGYENVIGFDASRIEVIIQQKMGGWLVVAGKEGNDLPTVMHPAWVRAVTRQVRNTTGGTASGHDQGEDRPDRDR